MYIPASNRNFRSRADGCNQFHRYKYHSYGQTGPDFGVGAYALDGGSLTQWMHIVRLAPSQEPLVTLSGLTNQSHVLSYQVTCNSNPCSSDFYQIINGLSGGPGEQSILERNTI